MKIKVQCPCGARFEFEVEPQNGRMPVAINCPTCGADDTELANAVIQQQSTSANPPASGLRISKSHATPASPAPSATSDSATPENDPESNVQLCPRHKTEPAVETCRVCGKPICLKCMEQFGYVCSVYCRQQATQKHIDVPIYAHQKSIVAGKSHALAKRLTYAVSILIILLLGFWFWYEWFARDYKIVYTLRFPPSSSDPGKYLSPDQQYQLIGPGQFIAIKDQQVSLFDVTQQKQLWSSSLSASTGVAGDLNDAKIITTTNDIWVCFSDQLARFDRNTGSLKDLNIKDKILSVTASDAAILVVSTSSGAGETLNRITLPDGNLQTEALTNLVETASTAPGTRRTGTDRNIKVDTSVNKFPIAQLKSIAGQAPPPEPSDDSPFAQMNEDTVPLFADGSGVVQMETKLLEHKTVSHAAMKAKGKSVLDGNNVTADSALDLAQEMANDSRREETGGVEIEDVSRYQVTLHRHFPIDVPDWAGEVIGPPRLYALKTVNVLSAGQMIYVFDKNNKKLWEAKLTFPVATRFKGEPALETPDALYFADLGILTRYDLLTGNVRWRFNTVGISKLQADQHGDLYLDTTTAGPDSIQYSQQINIKDKIHPVIVKLDPATSKVLWRLEAVGDTFYLSGKFLYSTMTSTSMAALHLEDGPDTHYYLNLLDPSNGKEIWQFHRGNERILKTEVEINWILLHFQDEVIVLKFFSL